jgi:hypothetical protein
MYVLEKDRGLSMPVPLVVNTLLLDGMYYVYPQEMWLYIHRNPSPK